MIRILQKDNRATKIVFAVIIGFALISMILYLVPGLYDGMTSDGSGVFATVRRPGVLGRLFGDTKEVKATDVDKMAQNAIQRQGYPAQYIPFLLPQVRRQVQQQMIAWQVESLEADRLGLQVSDADLRNELRTGVFAQMLFPGGTYIGNDKYTAFVQNQLGLPTTAEFEKDMKDDMERRRLREFATAGVSVSEAQIRDQYRIQGTKVKFDYAILTSEDVRKSINVTDAELQSFFDKNKARYATAVPETRKISYVAFTPDNLPGGKPQVTDADVQAYYNQHQDQYKVEEQVKVRHILIAVPAGADAKTDATAKAKAQDLLNKIKAGGDFAELAKANSDDPGSKASGGELGPVKRNGGMVPEFESAAMSLKAGQVSDLVKTQFGYHIIQAEERQDAHTKPLADVANEIRPALVSQKASAVEQSFAQTLVGEAGKNGLDKAAEAHGLHVQTTDYLAPDGVVPGLADGAQLLQAAATSKKGDAPKVASTGEGMAIFQVVDVKAAHAPTFADWKSHVEEDYKNEQVPQLLAAQLSKLSDRARQLNDLKKAAAEFKVTVKTSDLVDKTGNVPEVGLMSGPASVAFSLQKGAISSPINSGRSGILLSVVDKQEPTADEIAKNFEKTKATLIDQKKDEIFEVYMGTLMEQYEKKGGIHYSQKQKANPLQPQSPLGS